MLTRRTFLMTVASSVVCLCGCTLKRCDGSPVTYPFSNYMVDDVSIYITVEHSEFSRVSDKLSSVLYDKFVTWSGESSPEHGLLHEDYLNDRDDTLVRAVTFEVFYKNYPSLTRELRCIGGKYSEEIEGEREVIEPDNTVSDHSHSDNYTYVTVYVIGKPLDGGE